MTNDTLDSLLDQILPPREVLEEADKDVEILMLVKGTKADGKKFWCYLMVLPSKLMDFKKAEIAGDYILEDYGRIVEMGEGDEPDEDTKQRMADEHGANPNLEQEVLDAVKSAHEEAERRKKYKL